MRTARVAFPKFDFTAKIFLWASLCVLIFLFAAVFAWRQVGELGLQSTYHDMDQSLDGFETRLDERSVDLEDLGKWLTGQPEFINLLVSGPSANLTLYVGRLVKANMVDTVTVTDREGQVLARVSKDQPSDAGESILDEPGIRAGLSGQTSLGIRKDQFNNVVQSLVFPIRTGEQNAPTGVLRVGFYLDNAFTNRPSPAANSQLSYYYADGDTLVLFGDSQREPFLTMPIPPAALASWRQGRPSDYMILDTVDGRYLFKFTPFRSLDANLVAAYGVGLPLSDVQAVPAGLLAAMGGAFFVLAAVTGLAAYLLHRQYAVPLRTLNRAAQRISEGDLSIERPMRDDALDGLGKSVNAMYSRQRETVRSLTHEMNRKEAIAKSLAVGFIVTDENNRIVEWNSPAEALLGESKDKLLGQDWREIFAESQRPDEGTGLFGEAERNGSPQGFASPLQGRYSLRRDPRIILDVISTPLELEGRAAGYVHVLENASDQEQFARARDEFMMNAAHELRSPLAGLRTAVETLNEEQLLLSKQEIGFMLRTMHRSVLRFEAFVENLIDMGSIMAGRFVVRPIPCLLVDIVDDALAQVATLLEAKGQSVNVRSNCAASCRVFADPARITQVMVNLLSNASKYGPDDEAIVLWICDGERFVSIDVSDRGNGISPDEQAQLFQRFYRGKRGRIEGTGLGLGLALTKEIVEAHGGKIGIKSQVGEGTAFWFSLLKAL